MIAGLRNKFINQHKLEISLYLIILGVIWNVINIISKLKYSVYAKTVESFQKKIQNEYIKKTEEYFIKHININKVWIYYNLYKN